MLRSAFVALGAAVASSPISRFLGSGNKKPAGPDWSQGNEPLYYITLDGYPTQYGPKTMAFWSLFLHDVYLGIQQGSNPGPATIVFVNSNDYSVDQYYELEHAIAKRTPGNPECSRNRFCPKR